MSSLLSPAPSIDTDSVKVSPVILPTMTLGKGRGVNSMINTGCYQILRRLESLNNSSLQTSLQHCQSQATPFRV